MNIKKRITDKQNLELIVEYKNRFLKQKAFPPLPRPYKHKLQPILHTGRLMFIRGKYLFLGTAESFEDKNMYVLYSLLKSYWENVGAFGYYYIKMSNYLDAGKKEDAFYLAGNMALGERKFPTEEMIKKAGHKIEVFTLPNILTMIDLVDKDMKKRSKNEGAILREAYDEVVTEEGHTTFTGLMIASKWAPDGNSQLPDLKKKWKKEDKSYLLNLFAMSSLLFFFYWDQFAKLE